MTMEIRHGEFLAGVIEGFYGQPWSDSERTELLEQMASWNLNTYVYGPKDDLHHRVLWREPYAASQAEALAKLILACTQRGIHFVYALGPGLDVRYGSDADLASLQARFEQLIKLGCCNFALLFDDIPDRLRPEDAQRWGSFAAAQCFLTNALHRWVSERWRKTRFLFCPTPYCGRMANKSLGGSDYLVTLGRELAPEIDVFWTGPEIISREITVAHVRDLRNVLRRKPLIWDNLHANDYDARRFYCGPYSGRPPELREEVRGLLSNPNNEYPLNFVPLRTLAQFVHHKANWDPRQAYLSAVAEWLPSFATVSEPPNLDDLVLFCDCFYLPYEEGPEAKSLCAKTRDVLSKTPGPCQKDLAQVQELLRRLRAFCVKMTELRRRPLFYALSRRIWELREELDLLEGYLEKRGNRTGDVNMTSDSHLPGTFRGGMIARLQRLLKQQPDGSFVPGSCPPVI